MKLRLRVLYMSTARQTCFTVARVLSSLPWLASLSLSMSFLSLFTHMIFARGFKPLTISRNERDSTVSSGLASLIMYLKISWSSTLLLFWNRLNHGIVQFCLLKFWSFFSESFIAGCWLQFHVPSFSSIFHLLSVLLVYKWVCLYK